ncbi:MAG: hypothetical protein H7224_02865 [Polaromonas sp.]|nr:hypothetical protein [Polaromonas sp.]
MTAFLLLNHLLNLTVPAAMVALLLMLCSRVFGGLFILNRASAQSFTRCVAIIFIVNLLVLVVGLVLFGHDGKMVTYAAMLLAASGTMWALQRR